VPASSASASSSRFACPIRSSHEAQKRLTNLVCTNATPNPSLKAPTHYGRQRKAGLWPLGIITVQPYAAHLRGRL
jgi:hypothetical protein